jgi:hypothetical protein
MEERRGCVIFCDLYKYLNIVYILSITEFKFSKLSDLRFEAQKPVFFCKPVLKLDFMAHGVMESLSEI